MKCSVFFRLVKGYLVFSKGSGLIMLFVSYDIVVLNLLVKWKEFLSEIFLLINVIIGNFVIVFFIFICIIMLCV